MWTVEKLIDEIRRLERDGEAPNWSGFKAAIDERITWSDLNRLGYDNWGDAQEAAGYSRSAASNFKTRIADDALIRCIIDLMRDPDVRARRKDGIPLQAHFDRRARADRQAGRNPAFPNFSTFSNLGRSQLERFARVLEFCKRHDGYRDIMATIRAWPQFQRWREEGAESAAERPVDGYVYLAKTGRYYKIGYTNCVVRRLKEIKLELPEKLQEIHHIRTDDPSGIEAYWKNRFKSKITNGEWFKLDADDVRAFRRRKSFM